jgi:cation diffusion facilitator family transporter
MLAAQQNYRLQRNITLLSVVLLVVKAVAFYTTHSVAILSDALESIVNVVAGFIGLFSLHLAAQPSDFSHPNGHGKAEFLSSAVEGSLILVSALVIGYQAIHSWVTAAPLQRVELGLVLVFSTAVINGLAGLKCIQIAKKNNSAALHASGQHLLSDAYSTLAITAGLVVVYFTEIIWIDKLIALLAAAFILYQGYKIVRTAVAGMMDEADPTLLQGILQTTQAHRPPQWIDLHNVRIIKYGNVLHIDCHLTLPWYFNLHQAHKEIDAFREVLAKQYGKKMDVFIHTDACRPTSCTICQVKDCTKRNRPFTHQVEWTVTNIVQNQQHKATT